MGVGQLSESDAVDALRLPFSSSRHARGSNRRAITLIWGIPVYLNEGYDQRPWVVRMKNGPELLPAQELPCCLEPACEPLAVLR